MPYISESDKITYDTNLSKNQSLIGVNQMNPKNFVCTFTEIEYIHFSKYQIKETDMRIETATLTSPQEIDLTNGGFAVLITSPVHEDFGGVILDYEYDPKTGLYNYQCQDWSRKHQSKRTMSLTGDTLYEVLKFLITSGGTSLPVSTQKENETWRPHLSGLRPLNYYNDLNFGGKINSNPMSTHLNILVKDKREIEIIRDLVFSICPYTDVYFDKYGFLQIERFNGEDFRKSGVHIDTREISECKLKFDITNVITGISIQNSDTDWKYYGSDVLIDFFGKLKASASNIIQNEETSTGGNAKSTTSNTSNPYGNKAKKIWINADNGSGDIKSEIASKLRNAGWTVHDGGTCSNCHYSGYNDVTSDYQVYATVYNGFCAGTIREAYSSSIQNKLKNKGVVLVVMFDTRTWTNPNGMKPYRNGDFTGYNAGRAWDDNFSSSDPSINNVSQFLKNNNAKYCAGPSADEIVNQFLAGGYFKMKGIQ